MFWKALCSQTRLLVENHYFIPLFVSVGLFLNKSYILGVKQILTFIFLSVEHLWSIFQF